MAVLYMNHRQKLDYLNDYAPQMIYFGKFDYFDKILTQILLTRFSDNNLANSSKLFCFVFSVFSCSRC